MDYWRRDWRIAGHEGVLNTLHQGGRREILLESVPPRGFRLLEKPRHWPEAGRPIALRASGDGQREVASGLVDARHPETQHAAGATQAGRQDEAPDRSLQPSIKPLVLRATLRLGQPALPPSVPAVRKVAWQVLAHEVAT